LNPLAFGQIVPMDQESRKPCEVKWAVEIEGHIARQPTFHASDSPFRNRHRMRTPAEDHPHILDLIVGSG